jgi:hypothetical protein
MSTLTFTLAISALILIALFALNAVFYRKRRGRWLPTSELDSTAFSRPIKTPEIPGMALLVAALLAGVGARYVAPESTFSQWLNEPFAMPVFFVWAWITSTVITVLTRVTLKWRAGAMPK